MDDTQNELEDAKLQLEDLKRQDKLLEQIENRLLTMKAIAQYAVENHLTQQESAHLNAHNEEQLAAIQELKNLYNR